MITSAGVAENIGCALLSSCLINFVNHRRPSMKSRVLILLAVCCIVFVSYVVFDLAVSPASTSATCSGYTIAGAGDEGMRGVQEGPVR